MSDILNQDQQRFLLKLARQAIAHFLKTRENLKIKTADKVLKEKRGAFVTLRVNEELRGCIGYVLPTKPLYETVIEVGTLAATQDFRFEPLNLEELDETKIEISVLSLPQPIEDPKKIEVGKHGIIISKAFHKGLLLPQVPLEYNWDLETFLKHGCLKAGLDEDEWKRGAKIEIFQAQVFSD